MKIQYITVRNGDLKNLPPDEVTFLVLATDFANELSFLINAILASLPINEPKPNWLGAIHVSQELFYAELAAGKLYEAWQTIEKKYHGTALSKKYYGKLSPEGRKHYDRLKSYFSNPNNHIKILRNNHAFHSQSDDILPVIHDTPDEREMRIILGRSFTNTFFEFSSAIMHTSMLGSDTKMPHKHAQTLVAGEIIPLSMAYLGFIHAFGVALFSDIPHESGDLGSVESVKTRKVTLPFFIRK